MTIRRFPLDDRIGVADERHQIAAPAELCEELQAMIRGFFDAAPGGREPGCKYAEERLVGLLRIAGEGAALSLLGGRCWLP
jgi:hypothetical protein